MYTLFLLITILTTNAMDIIPEASYAVYDVSPEPSTYALSTRLVSFYTHEGNHITTIEGDFNMQNILNRLDPNAAKPQAHFYEIAYKMANFIKLEGQFIPLAPSGYFITFFDKHRNIIHCYPYDLVTDRIHVKSGSGYYFDLKNDAERFSDFPLDLTQLKGQVYEPCQHYSPTSKIVIFEY